jgi:hypothetical protein
MRLRHPDHSHFGWRKYRIVGIEVFGSTSNNLGMTCLWHQQKMGPRKEDVLA